MRQKLDNKQIEKSLSELSLSWKLDEGFLKKTYKFKTFENAIKFINSTWGPYLDVEDEFV